MLHLFEDWNKIAQRLRAAPTIALFLDFDGTLAQIAPRPELVALDSCVRHVLAALARSPRFRIWIISGRRQADVRNRVGVPGVRYLGLHGWEGRTGAAFITEDTERSLAALVACLRNRTHGLSGIWVENKEYALALHYREADQPDAASARAILHELTAPLKAQFRLQQGKSVWEILPRALADKGAAVRHELATLPARALPVYVGDDQVDEPAFTVLTEGLTVRVGRSVPSHARYRLTGVRQVRLFLRKLQTEFT